jgi:hypothetical protein
MLRYQVGAQKIRPEPRSFLAQVGFIVKIPAITDFRTKGTIIGPAGLTAVFGMGTGVTPPVWSPEMYPAGGQARPGTLDFRIVGHTFEPQTVKRMSGSCSTTYCQTSLTV